MTVYRPARPIASPVGRQGARRPLWRWLALPAAMLAAATGASAQPAPAPTLTPAAPLPPLRGNWLGMSTLTAIGGHIVGNPQAATKVTEYMSYTCPHCAHFEEEAGLPLRMGYIASGRVSYEVRHLLRDPVDVTVALLTNCTTPARFFALHRQFLLTQEKWLQLAATLTPAQRQRWATGPMPTRLRAIADDLKLYDIAAKSGIGRVAADRCLSDAKLMERIVGQTREAEKQGVDSTPSFLINGELAKDVHDWRALSALLGEQH